MEKKRVLIVTPFFFFNSSKQTKKTHTHVKTKRVLMKALTVRATRLPYGSPEQRESDAESESMWRPTDFEDFTDGGAYPEIFAMQFPNGIGWQKESSSVPRECPPSLPIDYETVTEMMLRVDGKAANKRGLKMTTDAHESYEIFANAFEMDAEAKEIAKFGSLRNAKSIEVIDNDTVDPYKFESEFLLCENGVGKPCVVRNVFKDGCYDVDLLDLFGEETLTVNDKAPARRSDKGDNKQNTLLVTAKRFKEYMKEYEKCDEDAKPVPFYNNGWRIFSTHPEKMNSYFENMHPRFLRVADETETILRETFKFLVKSKASTSLQQQVDAMTANVSRSLNKAFIGPKGTLTRLHYDSQDAHGFLAQTKGRKLFVLFHPSCDVGATNCCSSEDKQTELNQSLIDPLRDIPANAQKHLYSCVVEENEAIFIPHKWWHYAVSLDSSQTVMRNFFHSKTNVNGLVTMIMRSIANNQGASSTKSNKD